MLSAKTKSEWKFPSTIFAADSNASLTRAREAVLMAFACWTAHVSVEVVDYERNADLHVDQGLSSFVASVFRLLNHTPTKTRKMSPASFPPL